MALLIDSNRWLRWPVLCLVFLFPIVTLSVKNAGSAIYILLFLLAVIYAWPAWKSLAKDERRVLLGFVVFVALSLLSLFNTDNFHEATKQFERFFRFLMIVPVYLLMRRVDVPLGKLFLAGIVVGALVLGVEAWYQIYRLHLSNASGAYHKIVFGDTAILLAVLLILAQVTLPMSKWQRLASGLATLAAMYAGVLSLTRGAWLLLPIAVVCWVWMFRRVFTPKGWLAVAIVVLVGGSLLTLWTPAMVKHGVVSGIQDLKTYEKNPAIGTSWGIRLNLWRDCVTLFKEHPLLGVGLGDLSIARQDLARRGLANKVYLGGNEAHSIYFQALGTRGLIGLLALLVGVIGLPWWYFYRRWRWAVTPWQRFYVLGGVTTILAYAVFGLSEGWLTRNPFINTYAVFLIVFMYGIVRSFRQPETALSSG